MSLVEFISAACENLREAISGVQDENKSNEAIENHIKLCLSRKFVVDDFPTGVEWFNVDKPLSLEDLQGKLVVLDFFTYCCINCVHILPHLKRLEDKFFHCGLVVVGVHSAKFDNEKDSSNIRAAVQRYSITHPVVNDSAAVMWNSLGIPCWPTLLVLGPKGEALYILMGERNIGELSRFVEFALAYLSESGQLDHEPLPLAENGHVGAKDKEPGFALCFPGKVACGYKYQDELKELLAVADTGNHRVVVAGTNGLIEAVVGGPEPGFVDGSYSEARFDSPQGLVFFKPHLIYVADTLNHAIREVDLSLKRVRTLCGTGVQGSDLAGGGNARQQALSSPWDLAVVPGVVVRDHQLVLIAMAGTHQVWALCCATAPEFWKGRMHLAGDCIALAGSGREENRNNSYPHAAGFAQPSGLAYSPQHDTVYIADSESSSIRQLSLATGKVSALVGGDVDPHNLFCFGDVDGVGSTARLQHPLGVVWNEGDGRLYVADSYNHKLKVVDVGTWLCSTVLGSGAHGNACGSYADPANVQLNEPGGLCTSHDGKRLYIADTNNHCIKVVHLEDKRIEQLEMFEAPYSSRGYHSLLPSEISVSTEGGSVHLTVNLTLSNEYSLTPSAPQKWVAWMTRAAA
ncbi:NHL repeat-containing protein 2 isoform X2 [Bacillus rossius redtenbacheri]|uniref:NHL repeat-containing protein 2 isoform X2 n=1 Tax=Bacillus rossius redtenbacheri TaxID=93214 RepID=UPI002FDD625B